jgi:hypothetical protein
MPPTRRGLRCPHVPHDTESATRQERAPVSLCAPRHRARYPPGKGSDVATCPEALSSSLDRRGLRGFEGDKDEHIAPMSTSSLGPILASIVEAKAPQAATSSSAGVHALGIKGEINSENGAPSHI